MKGGELFDGFYFLSYVFFIWFLFLILEGNGYKRFVFYFDVKNRWSCIEICLVLKGLKNRVVFSLEDLFVFVKAILDSSFGGTFRSFL